MRLGTGTPADFRLGTTPVQRVFRGTTQVWARPSSGWSPAALFGAGQGGSWYDPSDLQAIRQDIAGTTPITADGQGVAWVNAPSRSGTQLTQSVVASRPTYRTSAGLHWLDFDGTGDHLTGASGALNFGTVTVMMAASEIGPGTASPSGVYWGLRQPPSGASPFWRLSLAKFSSQWSARVNGNVASLGAHGTGSFVTTMQTNLGTFRVNGAQTGTFTAQTITYSEPTIFVLGANPALVTTSPYRLFGLIVREGAITTEERTQAEAWLAAKVGITL